MSNGRFSLFPGAPSAHNLFSKRAIQYQWRSNGPVFTSAIIIACVAVWVVEMVFSLFWPLGLATMIYYGRFDPMTAVAQPWMFLTSMFLHSPKSVLHILFNMLALWSVGPVLEKMMGHWPFLALYVLSGLGGGLGLMSWAALWPGGTGWLGVPMARPARCSACSRRCWLCTGASERISVRCWSGWRSTS